MALRKITSNRKPASLRSSRGELPSARGGRLTDCRPTLGGQSRRGRAVQGSEREEERDLPLGLELPQLLHEDPCCLFVVRSRRGVLCGGIPTASHHTCLLLVSLRDADIHSSKEVEENVLLLLHMALEHSLTNRPSQRR
jgi:hypothetical protein